MILNERDMSEQEMDEFKELAYRCDESEGDGGFDGNLFDSGMGGLPRIDMYRAWVAPDLYPDEPQPRLENWHPEDLDAYCGGEYAKHPVRYVNGGNLVRL